MDLVSLDITCYASPVQIEGHAYGLPVYFRERYGEWKLTIDGEVIAEGKCPELMPHEHAMALTKTLIAIRFDKELAL